MTALCFQARNRVFRSSATVAVAAGAWLMIVGPCLAQTEIQGQEDDLQLRVQNASTKEILDALSAKFHVSYKLPAGVDRKLTGRYAGSLRRVLNRVLDGNDY